MFSMWKWLSFFLVVAVVLGACGNRVPRIAQPADGQRFSLMSMPQCVDVTLDAQDLSEYQETVIEFRGTAAVASQVQFQPGTGGPARFCKIFGGFGGGGFCSEQSPCTVVIIATRGEFKDIRTIEFVQ